MTTFGPDDIERLAKLAHLALDAEEAQAIARDLHGILDYVKELEALDVTNVEPTASVLPSAQGALRKDAVELGLDHDAALAEAPKADGGGFAVPSFVDEG